MVAQGVAETTKNHIVGQAHLVEAVARLRYLLGMDSITCLHIQLLLCTSLTQCHILCLQVLVEEMLGIE